VINKYQYKTLTWLDLESPTQDEVREVMEEYSINPLVAEEFLSPTLKPKVDFYSDYIYLILHFPAFRHTHAGEQNQEVDFVIGKDFLITVRYDSVDAMHKFSKVFEVNSVLDKGDMGDHAGFTFYYMLRKLYRSIEHEIESIEDKINATKDKIYSGKEKEMVVEISSLFRNILDIKQALSAHEEVLSSFEVASTKFFGEDFKNQAKSLTGLYFRVKTIIDNIFADLKELRETNNSLLFTKQNEAMKVLAIMAFITFPLSLIASIWGMNTSLPLVGHPYDFEIIITVMLVLMAIFFWYFKHKKWL
jgi:magnesium transporter